jgi:Uma2 family endonuclease
MTQAILTSTVYSPKEYLDLEINSDQRHEYIKGEIIPMTGGTPNHNKIALNLASALNFALRGQDYQVFITDQRLWIPDSNIYTYPDVMIVQGELQFEEGRKDTLINPYIIAEVLSKSTRNYDKDNKFTAYRSLSSFAEYLLIDQYSFSVEHYSKTENNKWLFSEYQGKNSTIIFNKINFQIDLIDLYDKVNFNE